MTGSRVALVSLLLSFSAALAADNIIFVKTQLDTKFRSEGVAVADVDGDGQMDILAGAFWYKGPQWKPHEIAPPKAFDGTKGYSDSFCCFVEELNGDGYPDLIVAGMPAAPARVYENPGPSGLDKHWKQINAFGNCSNETPLFVDVDGDGKRELLCGSDNGRVCWYSPGKKISDPWTGYALTGPKASGGARFAHGLGVGDINRDGRMEVLVKNGWYAAGPAAKWTFHPVFPPAPIHVVERHPNDPKKLLANRPTGHDCANMAAYDFDGDGDNDVLASSAHGFGVWWLEQAKSATGQTAWIPHAIDKSYSQYHALMMADINKDGLTDFVTGKRWFAHQGHDPGGHMPAVLCWYELRRGEKPSWIRHHIDSDSGVGTQFEVVDVNGDGREDIVTSNKKGVFYFEQRSAATTPVR